MINIQAEILPPIPRSARYLTFDFSSTDDIDNKLKELSLFTAKHTMVTAFGEPLTKALGVTIPGLKSFNEDIVSGVSNPATQTALWCWLKSSDRGNLVHQSYALQQLLDQNFKCVQVVDAFRYGPGFDLTGYEDGTENPVGNAAIEAAFARVLGAGMNGSSFVAVQQWRHDFDQFNAMTESEQDNAIGRRKSDNIELEDAPQSAHVKRTAQEDFEPEAFLLRRSMPWTDADHSGLYFVGFGKSFDAFEAQLKRMSGDEDGIKDALYRFTKPVTGSYFWCPPLKNGLLDLSALGIRI